MRKRRVTNMAPGVSLGVGRVPGVQRVLPGADQLTFNVYHYHEVTATGAFSLPDIIPRNAEAWCVTAFGPGGGGSGRDSGGGAAGTHGGGGGKASTGVQVNDGRAKSVSGSVGTGGTGGTLDNSGSTGSATTASVGAFSLTANSGQGATFGVGPGTGGTATGGNINLTGATGEANTGPTNMGGLGGSGYRRNIRGGQASQTNIGTAGEDGGALIEWWTRK